MKKKIDIENWLWKSEIKIFQSPPAKRTLVCQKKILWKSAIFHSIKLPFDAEVAEKSWMVSTKYLFWNITHRAWIIELWYYILDNE